VVVVEQMQAVKLATLNGVVVLEERLTLLAHQMEAAVQVQYMAAQEAAQVVD
jgi:hypothetical protein